MLPGMSASVGVVATVELLGYWGILLVTLLALVRQLAFNVHKEQVAARLQEEVQAVRQQLQAKVREQAAAPGATYECSPEGVHQKRASFDMDT